MSAIRTLSIFIGNEKVGLLYGLDDGRTYFQFDASYVQNQDRSVLSLSYLGFDEASTQAALLNPFLALNFGDHHRLPTFFRNLLPEGVLRTQLISDAKLQANDELGLLAYCGTDLPGNVYAIHENQTEKQLAQLITQGHDAYEMSSVQLPTPDAVSLSGVQPKVSLVNCGDGRYVMRSKMSDDNHFIGKLPASSLDRMPEVEALSMQLAKAVGVSTCETQLLPMSAIAERLPFSLKDDARNFLLVHRFDRDANTPNQRLHMEDFAQILSIAPEHKYDATYADIGDLLLAASSTPEEDIDELVRRITVNILIGNLDAHAKNFSVLYGNGQSCRLSPAYDIVAYAVFVTGQGQGLKYFAHQKEKTELTPSVVRELANRWQVPEIRLKKVIADTVTRALASWPAMIRQSAMSRQQKQKLLRHFKSTPFIESLRNKLKSRRQSMPMD